MGTAALLVAIMASMIFYDIATAAVMAEQGSFKITKITFLIQPAYLSCMLKKDGTPDRAFIDATADSRTGAWFDEDEMQCLLQRERKALVNTKSYIERMGESELLIFITGIQCGEGNSLEQFAKERLGQRVISIHSDRLSPKKREPYQKSLSDEAKIQLADELLEAMKSNGDGWRASTIDIILQNTIIATRIQEEMEKRMWVFDPQSFEAVAFGSRFERAVMAHKVLLSDYLNLSHPIEINVELSTSEMPLIQSASFVGQEILKQDVRLMLWTLSDGRNMALFTKVRAGLSDPPLQISLPFDTGQTKIYSEHGAAYWIPSRAELSGAVKGRVTGPLAISVYTGLGFHPGDTPAYIVVEGIRPEEFRAKLLAVEITPTKHAP